MLDDVLAALRLAHPLEPDLPWPWAAWREAFQLRGLNDPATYQLLERVGARQSPTGGERRGRARRLPAPARSRSSRAAGRSTCPARSATSACRIAGRAATRAGRSRSRPGRPRSTGSRCPRSFPRGIRGDLGEDALEHRGRPGPGPGAGSPRTRAPGSRSAGSRATAAAGQRRGAPDRVRGPGRLEVGPRHLAGPAAASPRGPAAVGPMVVTGEVARAAAKVVRVQDVDGTLIVSATDLVGFLECGHLTSLELGPDRRPLGQARRSGRTRRSSSCRSAATRTSAPSSSGSGPRAGRSTRSTKVGPDRRPTSFAPRRPRRVDAMRRGVDVVYQATFFDGRWRGHADFLLRVDGPSGARRLALRGRRHEARPLGEGRRPAPGLRLLRAADGAPGPTARSASTS